ncbi:YjfB family protein [Paenibacillus sp. y28]|uniref:YjfB family protein n=1 Tax=Paenibacillus sp. y28 TaxID=3129110 RepID=UPI0030193CB4
MDIAALSTTMRQAALAQSVGVQVFKLVQGQSEQQGQAVAQLLEQSVNPHLGQNVDIKI